LVTGNNLLISWGLVTHAYGVHVLGCGYF